MKIAILGAGALGCFFAAKLSQKYDVLLVGRDKDKIKRIQKNGISVTGLSRFKANRKNLTAVSDTKKFDPVGLLLVLVKAHQTEEAVRQHRHLIGKNTVVLTLQNGMGNVEAIKAGIGDRGLWIGEIIAGVTAHGVTKVDAAVVRHAGRGETTLGSPEPRIPNPEPLLQATARIFTECGIVTKVTKDIESALWGKLALNCAINPVAALLHIKNGVIPKNPHSFFLAKAALLEVCGVAKKKKITLPYKNPVKRLTEVCGATAGNVNSMLQDVMNKKRTEIDTINGAVVREAEKLKLRTPVNHALRLLVKAMERSYNNT